jgi:prophage antirepressor-like protein
MSQDEIVTYLKQNLGWHKAKDISRAIGMTNKTVYSNCKALRENHRIDFMAGPKGVWLYRGKA